jgi:uncharacterized protein YndB with AHSA1/START domain
VAHTDTSLMLVENITIAAPIAAVYAALTEPAELAQWWESAGDTVTRLESDLRVGGSWKISGENANGPFSMSGIFRVVDPPQHLEFTWRSHWMSADTFVRYDLEERAGQTTLTLTHTNFADQEDRDDHAKGWPMVLGWMAAYVTASK